MGRQFENNNSLGNCDGKSSTISEDFPLKHMKLLLEEGGSTPLDSSQDPGLPPWFDYHKFIKGQQYFNNNYYALFVSKLCGLITILVVPSILRVLVLTNQSTKPVTAFKRYLATITHMLRWYDGDLLEPTSGAHKSLMLVRGRHRSASIRASQQGVGHISQFDMVLTQFGFMGYAIVSPKKLGLTGTDEEVEGFIHFWRTVGYLIGIEDRFNLCRETATETRVICQNVLANVFVPGLQKPSIEFTVMSTSLIDGMWSMIPFLNYNAYLGFIKYLAGIKSDIEEVNQKSLTRMFSDYYSLILYRLQIFVHFVVLNNSLSSWFVRTWMNYQLWLTVLLTQNYPFIAYAKYGRMEVESPMTYH